MYICCCIQMITITVHEMGNIKLVTEGFVIYVIS
jgi:hypothetical protein